MTIFPTAAEATVTANKTNDHEAVTSKAVDRHMNPRSILVNRNQVQLHFTL